MAGLLELPSKGLVKVLDPGAGIGSLSAAVAAAAIRRPPGCAIYLVAFEADPALVDPLARTLRDCERAATAAGLPLTTEARAEDFLLWASESVAGSLWAAPETFGACVMNPPYRKVNSGSAERIRLERVGLQVTNLYTAFMGMAAALLEPGGQMSAITPRSFANGPYFRPFREFFLARMGIDRLHVYERRGAVFADADVLQENVVLRAVRGARPRTVTLSRSSGCGDEPVVRRVTAAEVVHPGDPQRFVHMPVDEQATVVARRVGRLPATLDLSDPHAGRRHRLAPARGTQAERAGGQ